MKTRRAAVMVIFFATILLAGCDTYRSNAWEWQDRHAVGTTSLDDYVPPPAFFTIQAGNR